MQLKKCTHCRKDIPHSITVCPYCHRDETGNDAAASDKVAAPHDSQIQSDLKLLGNDDPVIRKSAVERLTQKGPDMVPLLINLLNDQSHQGTQETAMLLGRFRDRRAVPALL